MDINVNHFKLDKYNLEKEACQQASLYQYYAQLVADKQKELDKKNLQLEQAESEFKIKAKETNPKATVDMLSCACSCNETLNTIKNEIIEIKHELATLKTATLALEQKRSMIEVEQRLQNNALYQQNANIGDHTSAEWAEQVLNKQLMSKA